MMDRNLLCFQFCVLFINVALAQVPFNETRRNGIPVLYARGTNYEVGYTVGRTFKSMIHEYYDAHSSLYQDLMPRYNTTKGKEVYDINLKLVQDAYPQYIQELQGISDGSGMEFYKLFLLHADSMIWNNVDSDEPPTGLPVGCSSFLINHRGQVLIGHNEDSFPSVLNHVYILHADIEEESDSGRKTVESFSSVCYAGELPGYTMGYNRHGVIYTMNVVIPKVNPLGKMPRHFVTRALLGARNLNEMTDIIKKSGGPGIGDGMSLNVGFWNRATRNRPQNLYNIETGPGPADSDTSTIDVLAIEPGQTLLHTNRYQRLNITDEGGECWKSSEHRENRYKKMPAAKNLKSMLNVLGDNEDKEYPFHRHGNAPDLIVTAVTGSFDLLKGTWSLYVNNPKSGEPPVSILSLDL